MCRWKWATRGCMEHPQHRRPGRGPEQRRTPTPCKSRVKRSWDEHPREEGQPLGRAAQQNPAPGAGRRGQVGTGTKHRTRILRLHPPRGPVPEAGVSGWCHPAPSRAQSVWHSSRNTAIFSSFILSENVNRLFKKKKKKKLNRPWTAALAINTWLHMGLCTGCQRVTGGANAFLKYMYILIKRITATKCQNLVLTQRWQFNVHDPSCPFF